MGIPEVQLETWSKQGAIAAAEATHKSVRAALDRFSWPEGVEYDAYLQGSYRNSTNIRGNSDVDLVVELTSVAYSNLTDEQRQHLKLTPASYTWSAFRNHVIRALVDYYGARLVDTSGSKSIKVLPDSGRLKADVVVAARYNYYSELEIVARGMTFWTTPNNVQIINYPKLHFDNGADKNSAQRTNGWYKPSLRMFKNARDKIVENNSALAGRFPSYFLECLFYNVPDGRFGGTFRGDYADTVKWLNEQLPTDAADKFVCQNWRYYLFGTLPVQWTRDRATEVVAELISLWNSW
jgi:hypothetical protein